jgi:hypothetical protein
MSSASLRSLLAVFLLAGAGQALAQSTDTATKPDAAESPAATQGAGLSADLFYRLLLGDVALQRGDADVAARAYIDAARTARDARLARRATEIAITSRERVLVRHAAQLWSEIDPAAERPKRVLAALAADDGKGLQSSAADDELRSRIERVLADAALSGPGVGDVFMQLNRLFAQQSDKRAVLALVRDVARPYPKTPQAHYAVALAAFAAGDDMATASEASDEIDRALALRPDWERAALLKAEILGRKSDASAMEWLEKFVASQPAAKSATGALAQRYVERKRFTEARALMQKLWDREPGSRDLEFAVAAVALQMKDYAEAERLLRDLKSVNYGEPGAVDLYLAQIAEDTKQYAKAIVRGSRSFASARCTASRAASPKRGAGSRGSTRSRRSRRSR